MSADDIYKLAGSVGTMITGAGGFIGKIQKRLSQIRDVKERGGKPGAFFFFTYRVPQYLYALALLGCALFGFVALIGGVAKLFSPPTGVPFFTPFFEDSAFQILGVAILILLVAGFNGLSWIVILLFIWVPSRFLSLKQSAAWYNLRQFSSLLDEPKPVFINPDGVANVADIAILELEKKPATSADFAATPELLDLDARGNTALIGCLLEKEYSVRRWPRPKWKDFYAAVAAAELNSRKLVSPDYVTTRPTDSDFYGILRDKINGELPATEPNLPDSGEARNDLSKALDLLAEKYAGSARNLAFSWWRRKPSLRLAFNRAQSFHPLDVSSMVPQFLKLAVRWGVWPNVKPGNFIYPYASCLAMLLFEKQALLTLPTVKQLSFKQGGQLDAYRETMRKVVEKVRENLSASGKPQHRQILKDYPSKWDLAAAVDVALWVYCSELKRKDGFRQWKLDDSGFVTRKGDSAAAKDDGDDKPDFPKED